MNEHTNKGAETMYHEYLTRYFGIYKIQDDHGWYLMETRGGTDQPYDHEPTSDEIDNYRNELCAYFGI